MKTALFLLAVLVPFLVIGCQDDNATNPVASSPASLTSLAPSHEVRTNTQHVIPLIGFLRDPQPFNSFYEIKGEAVASMCGGRLVDVTLVVDAELSNQWATPAAESYKVAGSSCDRIKLSAEGNGTLVKTYKIEGRNDGAYLQLSFNIKTDPMADATRKIELGSMAIKLPLRLAEIAAWTD